MTENEVGPRRDIKNFLPIAHLPKNKTLSGRFIINIAETSFFTDFLLSLCATGLKWLYITPVLGDGITLCDGNIIDAVC